MRPLPRRYADYERAKREYAPAVLPEPEPPTPLEAENAALRRELEEEKAEALRKYWALSEANGIISAVRVELAEAKRQWNEDLIDAKKYWSGKLAAMALDNAAKDAALNTALKWATGETEVDDGEDAEDALRYIRECLAPAVVAAPDALALTVDQPLAWCRDRPGASWVATIRDIETARDVLLAKLGEGGEK